MVRGLYGDIVADVNHLEALLAVKAIHTVIFASVGAAILVFVWEGLRGRAGRRSAAALGLAIGEAAVYVSNNQVCPLMPLAEELGAESGAVVDIFLPEWASRRIPIVSSALLLVGIMLNARARRRRGQSIRDRRRSRRTRSLTNCQRI